ncbi:uncharacterized protein MYCFIDRAFT_176842 [Pseudocercospora fijiensis CIRAD86]|uniref:Uncharacterized protein n=1 Tax=Pseudocercospora fijiensis (strain CIRAD86) TaxID=383855 RepID=M2ZR70_PSEFD|nr:uncharacterized protein MYCFIDRAFT_176842 [Pseudocercospora fijiensis CIRAD86]EME81554.1 hypothetical protein MYCFIDRAFT_176842 [Pseudocercospora fijiensis CIRAD86]
MQAYKAGRLNGGSERRRGVKWLTQPRILESEQQLFRCSRMRVSSWHVWRLQPGSDTLPMRISGSSPIDYLRSSRHAFCTGTEASTTAWQPDRGLRQGLTLLPCTYMWIQRSSICDGTGAIGLVTNSDGVESSWQDQSSNGSAERRYGDVAPLSDRQAPAERSVNGSEPYREAHWHGPQRRYPCRRGSIPLLNGYGLDTTSFLQRPQLLGSLLVSSRLISSRSTPQVLRERLGYYYASVLRVPADPFNRVYGSWTAQNVAQSISLVLGITVFTLQWSVRFRVGEFKSRILVAGGLAGATGSSLLFSDLASSACCTFCKGEFLIRTYCWNWRKAVVAMKDLSFATLWSLFKEEHLGISLFVPIAEAAVILGHRSNLADGGPEVFIRLKFIDISSVSATQLRPAQASWWLQAGHFVTKSKRQIVRPVLLPPSGGVDLPATYRKWSQGLGTIKAKTQGNSTACQIGARDQVSEIRLEDSTRRLHVCSVKQYLIDVKLTLSNAGSFRGCNVVRNSCMTPDFFSLCVAPNFRTLQSIARLPRTLIKEACTLCKASVKVSGVFLYPERQIMPLAGCWAEVVAAKTSLDDQRIDKSARLPLIVVGVLLPMEHGNMPGGHLRARPLPLGKPEREVCVSETRTPYGLDDTEHVVVDPHLFVASGQAPGDLMSLHWLGSRYWPHSAHAPDRSLHSHWTSMTKCEETQQSSQLLHRTAIPSEG